MTGEDSGVSSDTRVSILQKCDYDQSWFLYIFQIYQFQFYKSAIMTLEQARKKYGEEVSILQKYDYDSASEIKEEMKKTFQFYRSTIMTLMPLVAADARYRFNSTEVRLWQDRGVSSPDRRDVSILQKYDYDEPECPF